MTVTEAFRMASRYARYLSRARGATRLHSPFVYDLYENVIRAEREYYAFGELRTLRETLLHDDRAIRVRDFGAGSRTLGEERRVRQVAKTALQSEKVARLLFRLVDRFQPKTLLELGASLGLTTLYQYIPAQKARLIAFEGCPATAEVARESYRRFEAPVELVEGNLDETLASAVKGLDRIDYALFDANHRYEPTLRYFETCLPKAHEGTLFVFDDIYYSQEMEAAWEAIKAHEAVKLTVDLFEVGLVFFRDKQPEQHFVLKF